MTHSSSTVALHNESAWSCLPLGHDPCAWTSLHVSCHTCESLPIIDSWARHGFGAHSHVLYVPPVRCSMVQPGHCASVQTRLVCVQHIMCHCLVTLATRRPHRLPRAFSCALTGVTTASARCRLCASTTLSPCLLSGTRDSVVLPQDFLFSMTSDWARSLGAPIRWCLGPPDMKSSPWTIVLIHLTRE